MWISSELSDVVIIAGTERVFCHKPILCLASHHFYHMFTSSFKESSAKEIELHDVPGYGTLQLTFNSHEDRMETVGGILLLWTRGYQGHGGVSLFISTGRSVSEFRSSRPMHRLLQKKHAD